ncbi:hypothetical protein Tco_1416218, partial [Tanacetum coccineum]
HPNVTIPLLPDFGVVTLIIDETSKGVTLKAANRTGGDSSRPLAVYGPGHRCPEKALQVLLVDDEEEEKKGGYDEEHAPP